MVTAVIVLLPVAFQLRSGEHRLLDFTGYLLFAFGLFFVGATERWASGRNEQIGMIVGLAAVLLGLLLARPGRRAEPPSRG